MQSINNTPAEESARLPVKVIQDSDRIGCSGSLIDIEVAIYNVTDFTVLAAQAMLKRDLTNIPL